MDPSKSKKNISINIKKLNNNDDDSSCDEDYLPEDVYGNDTGVTTTTPSTSDTTDKDILVNFDKKRKRSSSESDLGYNYKIK